MKLIRSVLSVTLLDLLIFAIATVFIALDSAYHGFELEPIEAVSASIATIGNVGPGFDPLGPFGSYLEFPTTSKFVMIS